MCGRVTLTKTGIRKLASELDAELASDDEALYRPRYNVAPSQPHWIVAPGAGRRVLVPAVWGYLASGRPLVNLRGEQMGAGGSFRRAFAERRCAVVTDGFFEWTKTRRAFWYHREDGGLILLGGVLDAPPSAPHGGARFAILTTRPNRLVAEVHDRMPVILHRDAVDDWLTAPPETAARLIGPAPANLLTAMAVSKRVNSVKNDDAACLLPADAEPPDAQRSLF